MKKAMKIVLVLILAIVTVFALAIMVMFGHYGIGPFSFLLKNQKPILLSDRECSYSEMPFSVISDGETVRGIVYMPDSVSDLWKQSLYH